MSQQFDTDTISRYIEASPEDLFAVIADVTRTPELSPEIRKAVWLDGATNAAVGARFKAWNNVGRGPSWSNKPVITVLEPGREIAWERTEFGAGTVEWRYRFEPEGSGTRVTESYKVTRPIKALGWFIIETLYRCKDRRRDLRRGMEQTLDRLTTAVGAPVS